MAGKVRKRLRNQLIALHGQGKWRHYVEGNNGGIIDIGLHGILRKIKRDYSGR